MQKSEYWILCGGADPPYPISDNQIIRLDTTKRDQQSIKLKVEDIGKALITDVPETLVDLLEIAAYVYCADQAVSRGSNKIQTIDTKWYQTLHFVIPVRQPDFWSNRDLVDLLSVTLNFLYGGTLTFHFIKHSNPPPLEGYLDFGQVVEAEEVVLFSGGLDSLAGAIQEIAVHNRHVALVSHRSVSGIYTRQNDLFKAIKEKFPDKKVDHVPIWVHKKGFRGKADTQRTRSFLFASLAVTVAKLLRLSRIRFYENGITSINLPIATQFLGSRASRTTHPQVLHYFDQLFSLITGDEFKVENPFALKTKTEVVSLLGETNCKELIKETVSCSGTRFSIKTKQHCCICTQCIDRRFATLANGYEKFDPDSLYSLDLLTGHREPGEQRALALSFVKTALEIENMTDRGFFTKFGEASRAIDFLEGRTEENAQNIFNLYKRHAEVVSGVMEEGIRRHTKTLLRRELPKFSLLFMTVGYTKPALSPESVKPGKIFPSPENLTWKEVEFIINSESSLKIKARGTTRTYTFSDLGFNDERRGDMPDNLWELLLYFADHNGDISWEENPFHETRTNLKHAISRLRKRLQAIMEMDEDPFYPYRRQTESSYRLKFKIIDESYN